MENQVKVGRNLTIVGVTDDMLECVLFSSSLSKYVYIDMEKTTEYCPHCGNYVQLPARLGVYKCPKCKSWIPTCSMCTAADLPNSQSFCQHCALDENAKYLNSFNNQ